MVIKEVISQVARFAQEEFYVPLPQKRMEELQSLDLCYPGWKKDYDVACDYFRTGIESRFNKAVRKLKDKQRVYDDYRAFTRLNDLASLVLSYPGSEADKQEIEAWHLSNPSNPASDFVFHDKLEGLRNRDQLFFGIRDHPNVQALDELVLTYPGWEEDYQDAIAAHCDMPRSSFPSALHCLKEKEKVYQGDRSHWRLVELDRLKLSYPDWEDDVLEIEDWHYHSVDNAENSTLFAEVIESMKDQEQIFLGWDYDGDEEDGEEGDAGNEKLHEDVDTKSISSEDKNLKARSDFYKLNLEDAEEMRKCYNSISESLNSLKGRKKKLAEMRSASASTTSEEPRDSPPQGSSLSTPPKIKPKPRFSDVRITQRASNTRKEQEISGFINRMSENEKGPPKQVKLGKCEICFRRPRTHVFVPCGHLCTCAACSHEAMKNSPVCPICRTPADSSHRVFLT